METNNLQDLGINGNEFHQRERRSVDWTTPNLRITRLRLLSDAGYPSWDVSYCYGMIGDEEVEVMLPFSDLPKRKPIEFIIGIAKRAGFYCKPTGILDKGNWSMLM